VPESIPLRRRAAHWLETAGDALGSVFLPADCLVCETLLERASRVPICEKCLASFTPAPTRACDVCGQPLASFDAASFDSAVGDAESADPAPFALVTSDQQVPRLLCPNCNPPMYAFARARSLALYEDGLVGAILALKYKRIEPLGKWFAERLAELVRKDGERLAADLVVPVPLHKTRERERGYNQAELLAKPLAKALKLPYRPVLLLRTKSRPEKQMLTARERWESVRGAFATRPGSQVDKQRVLLVDDVLTTGATLDACARALLDSGAKSVLGLTVARAARSQGSRSGRS
jgi:ComF family protein